MRNKFLCLLTSVFFITSCSHVISSPVRESTKKDLTFPLVLQNPTDFTGQTVIWGGVVIETLNRPDGTVLKVLETPLDYYELPQDKEQSRGRFIAKTPKYFDPEVYKQGEKITLAGEITGKEVQPLGEMQYIYPVVTIKEIHLWKKQDTRDYWSRYPSPFWWYPWYY